MTFKINTLKKVILFILLFLAAMNFQAKFFYFVFGAFLLVLCFQRKALIDRYFFMYIALGILMAIYNADEGILSVIRCFAPCCCYFVGMNIVALVNTSSYGGIKKENIQSTAYAVLASVSLGAFAHFTINYVYNLGQSVGRNTNDIWTGMPMAATGQMAFACMMAGFAVAAFLLPYKKSYRWMAICAIFIIFLYNLILAGRTILVILSILLVCGSVYLWKKSKRTPMTLNVFFKLFILLLIMAAIYVLNIGNIQEYIKASVLFERFQNNQNVFLNNEQRNFAKIMFLSNMLKYPFGGLHMRASYGYAHDLLLDGYDEYGILGFVLLAMIVIVGAIRLMKVVNNTSYDLFFRLTLLLVIIAILLEFLVEPILEGMPWLFSCYCLINGLISRLYHTKLYCK